MRRFAFVTLVAAALLAGCGKTTVGKGRIIVMPPIPDGEVSQYVMLANGEQNGVFLMAAFRDTFKNQAAWRLELTARTVNGGIPTVDSSIVFVTRDSLFPLTSFRFVKTGNAMVATAANYLVDGVAVSTWSAQDEKQRMLPRSTQSFDADQLTFLCRALRPPQDRPVNIDVVSPMGPPDGGIVFEGKVGAPGDQSVTVPAGTFDCARIVLNVGPHVIMLWYEKTGSRRLVRYEQMGAGMVMELVGTQVVPRLPS